MKKNRKKNPDDSSGSKQPRGLRRLLGNICRKRAPDAELVSRMKVLRSLPDAELVSIYFQTGESGCFSVLYERYAKLVLGSCILYLHDEMAAQDATADVFTRLLKVLRETQPQHFKSWLYKVTSYHCLSLIRKGKGKPDTTPVSRLGEDDLVAEAPAEYDTLSMLRLQHALNQLPEGQKTCLEAFYFREMSYQEIARKTGIELGQVKSHIQNGKRTLRKLLPPPENMDGAYRMIL